MYIDFAAKTDRGRVRKRNEDNYVVLRLTTSSNVCNSSVKSIEAVPAEDELLFVAVADGMGGHSNGDTASRMVVEHFATFARDHRTLIFSATRDDEALRRLLSEELKSCHQMLRNRSAKSPELWRMGSTATIAVVIWPRLFVAHVDDSRCYLHDNGQMRQLTRDHSLAQYFVDQGMMNAAAADMSDFRHQLWNALGGSVDSVTVDFHEADLQNVQNLLFCTDGLTNHLTDAELAIHLRAKAPTSEICGKLVSAANKAGGQDNTTCVLVRFPAMRQQLSPTCHQVMPGATISVVAT